MIRPDEKINLESINLESEYSKLTEDEKILIFCKLHGLNHVPPGIEQFLCDDYYLGQITSGGTGIYDYWHKELAEMFPSPVVNKYPYISLGGAIGIGKSTLSKIAALYTHCKLDCMIDPWKTFGLIPGKPITFMFAHVSAAVVEREFLDWFDDVMKKSPYFQNLYGKHNVAYIASGLRDQVSLGSDLLFSVISEANFYPKPEQAIGKINTAVIRFKSRFQKSRFFIGNIIVDTSAKGDNGPSEIFEYERPRNELLICKAPHWEVKKKDYLESAGKTFRVYKGDSKTYPYVLDSGQKLPPDQDPGRVLEVPVQLEADFKSDIIKSLQDLAGVSTTSGNSFFDGNITHLVHCCSERNLIPDTINVDFYDKTQNLYEQIYPMLQRIPKGTFLFCHLDLGLVTDHTGFSIVYFSHWDSPDGLTKEPVYICPLTVSIDRLKGQQTSLWHIYQMLSLLSKDFSILVSADTAFSAQILQDLERDGVPTRNISLDRTDTAAIYFKNVVNRERITIPENKRLLREVSDLLVTPKGKVDHPKVASPIFDNTDGTRIGSKDVFDSLAGALWSCHLSVTEGTEKGILPGYTKQLDVMARMAKSVEAETAQQFQGLIEGIF
jgi:hypothetical protein